MAQWKSSFANMVGFFTSESQGRTAESEDVIPAAPRSFEVEQQSQSSRSSSHAEGREELDAMFHDIWVELIARVRGCQPKILEGLLSAPSASTETGLTVSVAREVFKREMIIALEDVFETSLRHDDKKNIIGDESKSMEYMKLRLKEMSESAMNAEEALQLAIKERNDLQDSCNEVMEEHEKMTKMLEGAKEEIENLREMNSSLENETSYLKSEVDELRQARKDEEVKALRAQHDAEMAHLIAKQSALQAKMLEKQLQEAESSSKVVQKRMQELQKVQKDLRRAVASGSRQPLPNIFGTQNGLPMHNNSRSLGQHGATHTLRKGNRDGRGRIGKVGGTAHVEKLQSGTEASSPRQLASAFHSDLPGRRNPVRKGGTKILRLDPNGNLESVERSADANRERSGLLNRFRNLARGVAPNADVEGARDTRSRFPGLAELRRLLPLNERTNRRSDRAFRSSHDAPQTLDALAKNLEALENVVLGKQKEVDRLRVELRIATQQANVFEQRLRKEQHTRVQMRYGSPEKNNSSREVGFGPDGDGLEDGEKGERRNFTSRLSCHTF